MVTVLLPPFEAQVTISSASGSFRVMVREISAGGVVVRNRNGNWWMAAIEPAGDPSPSANLQRGSKPKTVLALPKGLVDPGEKPAETAIREVYEETGITADLITKLDDIKYVYTRAWGDGQRVFKIVSFYLMQHRSGRINHIAPNMRIEVARARWVLLQEAPDLLAYKGEKQIVKRALEYVAAHPELQKQGDAEVPKIPRQNAPG
ncbi:MAG: hydrolase [Candidatus Sulfotelmatobacter sp.]|nr:hydrolase [Candidatus Sulfotelmatobacter sp.]